MFLLNAKTHSLEEFTANNIPNYAILSHTWDHGEITFRDLQEHPDIAKSKPGYVKINLTCAQAICDGYEYAWIDTCCIDKSSSAELSEAINSMFRLYQRSEVCYVYLTDLDSDYQAKLRDCRWWRRGFTLQELLASSKVRFYTKKWTFLGDKSSLLSDIIAATGIHAEVVSGSRSLHTVSVAQRMSWAAYRETTRIEDMAYCLLGIFGVNMAPMYGEGSKAFIRLQEVILKETDDLSIFAWDNPDEPNSSWRGLFATSPSMFRNCTDIEYLPDWYTLPMGMITSSGLSIQLALRKESGNLFKARLNCQRGGEDVTIYLEKIPGTRDHFVRARRATSYNLARGIKFRVDNDLTQPLHPFYDLQQVHVRQTLTSHLTQKNPLRSFMIDTVDIAPNKFEQPLAVFQDPSSGILEVKPCSDLIRKPLRLRGLRQLTCVLVFEVLHALSESAREAHPQALLLVLLGSGNEPGTVGCHCMLEAVTAGSQYLQARHFESLERLYTPEHVSDRSSIFDPERLTWISIKSFTYASHETQCLNLQPNCLKELQDGRYEEKFRQRLSSLSPS